MKQTRTEEEKIESELNEQQQKIEELTDTAKRIQAEFENYKKKSEKDQQQYIELGKIMVLKKMLPLFDSFEQAKDNKEILPLYNQLNSALESLDVKRIEAKGEKFDPHIHECVCQEESSQPKGTVTEVVQSGYKIKDYIIRHPIVKVSKGKKEEETKNDNIKENTEKRDT